jgi:hypothetical protein
MISMDLSFIAYFVIGMLLGNGMPHFVFGRAKKIFRSPFGQKSKPKVNVMWGLANFFAATIISIWEIFQSNFNSISLIFLLAGFWLTVLMFGFSIKRFLNE